MSAPVRGAHISWSFNALAAGTSGTFTSTGGSGAVFSLYVGWYGSGSAPTITSNKAGTWTQVGSTLSLSADTNEKGALFECVGGTGGSGHTITVTFSGSQTVASCWMQEWTGLATTSPLDKAPGGNSATASPYLSLSTGTTSQADEVVLAYCSTLSASGTEAFDWSANSFTATGDVRNNADADQTGDSAYRIVSSTGSYQASFTSSNAGTTAAVVFVVSYKGAVSGTTIDVDAGTDTVSLTSSAVLEFYDGNTVTIIDSQTVERFTTGGIDRSASDSIAVADDSLWDLYKLPDIVALTDTTQRAVEYARQLADSVASADNFETDLFSPADAVVVSDSLLKSLEYGRAPNDTVSLTDSAQISTEFSKQLSDTLVITDARTNEVIKGIFDTAVLSDSVTAGLVPGSGTVVNVTIPSTRQVTFAN